MTDNDDAARRRARALFPALLLSAAASLIQCAHGQPGTGNQPAPSPQPQHGEARIFRDCTACPEMVEIPGGTFRMGLGDGLPRVNPPHMVTVRPFALGRNEITWDQYAAFADATGRSPRACSYRARDKGAARCLTWHDAQAYVEWLSYRTGQLYRLASEAEWEYVAQQVDVDGVSYFGVEDLFTDVVEWTADCWSMNYHGAPSDGSPWAPDPACRDRVVRGQASDYIHAPPGMLQPTERRKRLAMRLRAAERRWKTASRTTTTTGVRVARTLLH